MASRPRVLLAVLVYGGGDFVGRCLHSATRVEGAECEVRAIVLDDCTPDDDWSAELRRLCRSLGVDYYRAPRNLGIPRNMNLALGFGVDAGYDYVVLVNSDTILPSNLGAEIVKIAEAHPEIGSITAWSNNVSIFSLENADPGRFLERDGLVDWISSTLCDEFGPEPIDTPSAVGFCLAIPTRAVREVGYMDPVFGRGYCEEIDWSQRSRRLGFRIALAPSVFVYHMGSASSLAAGLLEGGDTTVPRNERIIDYRYPSFRRDVGEYAASQIPDRISRAAHRRLVLQAARDRGYAIEATNLTSAPTSDEALFTIEPDGRDGRVRGVFAGFSTSFDDVADPIGRLEELTGRKPTRIVLRDFGAAATRLLEAATAKGLDATEARMYPERV